MSAFYLIGLLLLWLIITGTILISWNKSTKVKAVNCKHIHIVFGVLLVSWLIVTFWFSGGRKYYYDAEINRLCAIDGGVKVFETVTLPANNFDKNGKFSIRTKQFMLPTDDYYLSMQNIILREGNPTVSKSVTMIIRKQDGTIMGEAIHYSRGGGDLIGPWHASSVICPTLGIGQNLEQSIFIKEN